MLILKGASHEVNAVRFTPDGRGLVWSTERGDQVWADWASGGKPAAVAKLPAGVWAKAVSPDGRYALVGGGGHLTLYDTTVGMMTTIYPEHQASYVALAVFTPDGRWVITLHHSEPTPHLRCTQIEAPHMVLWSVPTPGSPFKLVFLDAGRFVSFVDVAGGCEARVRDCATGEPICEAQVAIRHWYQGLTTSPDRRLVVGYDASKFLVYQSADLAAAPIVVRNTSRKAFSGLAFHPAGRYLAATSNDASVKLYDVATWEVTRTFDWSIGRLRSVAFSPDGTLAAAGGDRGLVVVWDFDE